MNFLLTKKVYVEGFSILITNGSSFHKMSPFALFLNKNKLIKGGTNTGPVKNSPKEQQQIYSTFKPQTSEGGNEGTHF